MVSASCALVQFSSLPAHVLTAVFYRALPYEKDKNQGLLIPSNLFMAFKFTDASSSLCPPERKTIPTKAGTTVLDNAMTVLVAISSAVTLSLLGLVLPAETMLGLSKHPSKNTFWS